MSKALSRSIILIFMLAGFVGQTPPPVSSSESTPTPVTPPLQELAEIENYAASRFYPNRFVVIKDIPVRLYITRLHSEHVNMFTIAPYVKSTAFFRPGTLGVIEFTPDRTGRFSIVNEGHGYTASLIVVENADEAKAQSISTGLQEFSLVHDFTDSRLVPERLVIQKGVPVKIYNTGLGGEDKVYIEPFYLPSEVNVEEGKITVFEFTPTMTGEFTISYEKNKISGVLVVE